MVDLIFYGISALLLLAALNVVLSQKPIIAAFSLILCFFLSSMTWVIFQAEFLALALIFVYVGAVMTLFLFVVMMVHQDEFVKKSGLRHIGGYLMFFTLVLLIMYGLSYYLPSPKISWNGYQTPQSVLNDASNSMSLAKVLYTDYFISFQAAGFILLAAIVSAVSLVFRGNSKVKSQNITDQTRRQRHEGVELVKMKSVKKEASS